MMPRRPRDIIIRHTPRPPGRGARVASRPARHRPRRQFSAGRLFGLDVLTAYHRRQAIDQLFWLDASLAAFSWRAKARAMAGMMICLIMFTKTATVTFSRYRRQSYLSEQRSATRTGDRPIRQRGRRTSSPPELQAARCARRTRPGRLVKPASPLYSHDCRCDTRRGRRRCRMPRQTQLSRAASRPCGRSSRRASVSASLTSFSH